MKLVEVAAGFTPGEADALRRAMGAWRRTGGLDAFRAKLRDGMLANGYSLEYAERLFDQIRGFSEYGFPESHAASFALLVYASAWLKHHYPAAFCAALINSQPMGFYAPAQLVADARKHQVEIRPVDVNRSEWDCTLEAKEPSGGIALRLGLRLIRGLRRDHADRLTRIRRTHGGYRSVEDLAQRTGLPKPTLSLLAKAAAFDSLNLARRQATWQALGTGEPSPLFDASEQTVKAPALPALSPPEEVAADYRDLGLSLRGHPVQFMRPFLERRHVRPCGTLGSIRNGAFVTTAGIVLLRQRPGSAKGITFMTLEDETGQANLVVYPDVWERFRHEARRATALQVSGQLQHDTGGTTHLVAARLVDLSDAFAVAVRSRDFH